MSVPANLAPARGARTPEPEAEAIDAASAAEGASLITRLGRLWERGRLPSESEVRRLFEARLTDVAANKLARRWCEQYSAADGKDRRLMLAALAQVRATYAGDGGEGARLFKRFNAQAQGLRFLVELRADMLRWRKQVAGIQSLDKELEGLLSAWFDVGLLELRPLTWDSPASLLEKLILYEAVHEITSWDDLRRRVSPDRRCYAYFHPQMPGVPLIFVEVAFASQMADNVQVLPPQDLDKARWAIFYSISNTQPGLKGISFGNFLLKRVVEQLLDELPKLKSFATLSPIPGFSDWLGKLDAEAVESIVREDKARAKERKREGVPDGQRWVSRLAKAAQGRAPDVVKRAGFRLAACYLQSMKNSLPLDAVARFHLGNGARIERLNWAADTSQKGLKQSCGLMVNYLYDLDELDTNLAKLGDGKPQVSRSVGRVA